MKFLVKIFSLLVFLFVSLSADGLRYIMRVDGLACPYCAYGIEKKLKAINGIKKINVKLEKGLVIVDVKDGVILSEKRMIKLFNNAGFTFRSMTYE
ncbi:MAG: heavy metal transport/detoxification protein [Sulfurimonas sp.]|nr:MAG: heavy metal transport/detoxification protein [Sulfurimonas sp.]